MVLLHPGRISPITRYFGFKYLNSYFKIKDQFLMSHYCINFRGGMILKANVLEDHLIRFILRYRAKNADGSQRPPPIAFDGSLWRAHCQVFVFWFQDISRQIDHQVFVTTHWDDIPDLKVKVYGPFAPSEIIPKVEESLQDPAFTREIVSDGLYLFDKMPFHKFLEGYLVQEIQHFLKNWGNPAFHGPFLGSYVISGASIGPKIYLQQLIGNFCKIDLNEEFEKTFPAPPPKLQQKSDTQTASRLQNRVKGFGVHLYPPIWIGEAPKLTFRDKVEGVQSWNYRKVLGTMKYRGKTVLYQWDGFIAIVEEDRDQALRDFNRIMAIAFLLGFDVTAVRAIELGDLTVDLSHNIFHSQHFTMATPRTEIESWTHKKLTEREIAAKKVMTEQELLSILHLAEKPSIDEELDKDLNFMLEGYTHYRQFQFPTAFMVCYIVIERYISRLFEESNARGNLVASVHRKRNHSETPTTDEQLRHLTSLGLLSAKQFRFLMKLKQERNAFIHRGANLTEEDAGECFDLCKVILGQILHIPK